MPFYFNYWNDESDPISSIGYLQAMPLTRLHVTKNIVFSPGIKARYESEKSHFVGLNSTDAHQEVIDNFYVDGYQADTLVYDSSQGTLPWFTNISILRWLDFVNLGFIQRHKLIQDSYEVTFQMKKVILN